MKNWKNVLVKADMPLCDSIGRIDESGLQMALVIDDAGRLVGTLSDGDVRRAILRNKGNIDVPTSEVMNKNPTTAMVGTPQSDLLATMRRKVIHHIPIIDDDGMLVGLSTMDDLTGMMGRSNWVVLMAGGIGQRLRPLTENCPKPMLLVGDKPILETILESFIDQGFRNFYLAVNYMAETVIDYFGDGSKWGANIKYLHENKRLGTAGALSLLPEKPTEPLLVMNGDLLTKVRFDNMLDFHSANEALATMAVREYDFQVPYGVVRMDGANISKIDEKPVQKFYVSAGIYVLDPAAMDFIPHDNYYDMPTLFDDLIAKKHQTAAYPLREYWLDIGRLEEYERARREWAEDKAGNDK